MPIPKQPFEPDREGPLRGVRVLDFSRLVAGDKFLDAILAAHRAAARNVEHRGATGLANFLRGELSLT